MRLAHLVTLIVFVGLLGLLVWMIDVNQVWAALRQVSAGYIGFGLLLVQIQIVLSACRWRFTARRLGQDISWRQAIGEYYVATAVNQLLPGGAAGDALRAYRLRNQRTGSFGLSAKSVIFERLSGQISFFALFIGGLFFWPLLPSGLHLPGGATLALPVIALAVLLLLVIVGRAVKNLKQDLQRAFVRQGAWLIQGSISFTVVLAYAGCFLLASYAVGAPLPLVAVATIIPLCLLAMLIPTGLGGWGTREASAAALWPLAGLANADGVAASVLYGALALVGSAPGLVILALSIRKASVSEGL